MATNNVATIAVGRPNVTYGVGRVGILSDDWRNDVGYLIEKASVVIILPSRSAGTMWELDTILTHYLRKTIFAVPSRRLLSLSKFRADYKAVKTLLAARGIDLPRSEGHVLLFDPYSSAPDNPLSLSDLLTEDSFGAEWLRRIIQKQSMPSDVSQRKSPS